MENHEQYWSEHSDLSLNSFERMMPANRAYFKIGEVAELTGVKPYVLRYWESEFSFLSPARGSLLGQEETLSSTRQSRKSQQRVYTRLDVKKIMLIKNLLHEQRFSIEGAKKRLVEMKRLGNLSDQKKMKTVIEQDRARILQEAISQVKELLNLCLN